MVLSGMVRSRRRRNQANRMSAALAEVLPAETHLDVNDRFNFAAA
jgi:hypothetical protein